jgi:hypothetical protein
MYSQLTHIHTYTHTHLHTYSRADDAVSTEAHSHVPPSIVPALQAFYYRANYIILLVLCATVMFLRNVSSLLALTLCTLAGLCCNDSFAGALNDRLLRLVRRIHPSSALKLRARASAAQPEGSLGWVWGVGRTRWLPFLNERIVSWLLCSFPTEAPNPSCFPLLETGWVWGYETTLSRESSIEDVWAASGFC